MKKILIIRNDNIGDLVLSTPVFRETKKYIPGSKLSVIVSKLNQELVKKNKNIDDLIVLDLLWKDKSLKNILEYLKVINRIRKEKFDVGIDLRGSKINSLLLFLGGIKERVGFKKSIFLTKTINRNKEIHETHNVLEIVNQTLNIEGKDYWPEIATDKEDENFVNEFVKKNKLEKFICIVPGSNHEYKRWSEEKFNDIIIWIKNNYKGYKVLLIGGEDDRKIIDYLGKNENTLQVINFNLRRLSILFKKSELVIAHDGGPMHLAWASKSRLIALWGPTPLEHVKPLGDNSVIIYHKVECYPCYLKKCEKPIENRCINLISVEEVKKQIMSMLSLKKSKNRK